MLTIFQKGINLSRTIVMIVVLVVITYVSRSETLTTIKIFRRYS